MLVLGLVWVLFGCWDALHCSVVSRENLAKLFQIDLETTNEVFSGLGNKLPDQLGWEFKLPTDTRFADTFASVVARQRSLVGELMVRARFALSGGVIAGSAVGGASASGAMNTGLLRAGASNTNVSAAAAVAVAAAQAAAAASNANGGASGVGTGSGGSGGDTEIVMQAQQQLNSFLSAAFQKYGVLSRSFISELFKQQLELKDGNHLRLIDANHINTTLLHMAVRIGPDATATAPSAPAARFVRKTLHNDRVDKV